jgi:hypothetical protein
VFVDEAAEQVAAVHAESMRLEAGCLAWSDELRFFRSPSSRPLAGAAFGVVRRRGVDTSMIPADDHDQPLGFWCDRSRRRDVANPESVRA